MTGAEPQTTMEAVDRLTTRADILACLARSFTAVHAAIQTLTPENENNSAEDVGVGGQQSRASLAAWIAAHGYDHYGQLVEYLRMNGITPPSGTVPPAR